MFLPSSEEPLHFLESSLDISVNEGRLCGFECMHRFDIDTNGKLTRKPKIATFSESLKLKEQQCCPHNGIFAARVFLSFGETFEFLQVLLGVSCIKS